MGSLATQFSLSARMEVIKDRSHRGQELRPLLWGHVRFHTETANSHLDPTTAKQDKALSDLLNDLK